MPIVSSGVRKRRPVLSMSRAQKGSVPMARHAPAGAVTDASAVGAKFGALSSPDAPAESVRDASRT
jgi:hypothetical protein